MSISNNTNIEELIKQLQAGWSQGTGYGASAKELQEKLQSLLAKISELQGELGQLQEKLASMKEKYKDPTPEQKKEMDHLQSQINGKKTDITSLNDQASSDKARIGTLNKDFQSFIASTAMHSQSMNDTNKLMQSASKDTVKLQERNNFVESFQTNAVNQTENLAAQQSNAADQVANKAEQASKAIANYASTVIKTTAEALDLMNRIMELQKKIDTLTPELQKLETERLAVAIASIFVWALIPWLAVICNKLASGQTDLNTAQNDIGQAQGALATALTTLSKLDIGQITNMISQLFSMVDKMITKFSSGNADQNSMQEATQALAIVLSFMQMITAKVHQMKAQDQVWMDRANAMGSEMAVNKSQVNLEFMTEMMKEAKIMKIVGYIVQAALLAAAVASGGALAIATTALMAALSASGAFEKMTDAIAQAISSKKDAPVWAKVVAEAIVAAACVATAAGIASAAEQIIASVTRQVTAGMTTMIKNLIESMVKTLVSSLETIFSGKGIGIATMFFAANNGFADLLELCIAAGMGKADKSKKELEKEQLFQILQIIMGVVQAIIMAVAGYKTFSGEAGQSLMQKIVGDMTKLEQILMYATGVQMAGQGLNVASSSGMAVNYSTQADLTKNMGAAEGDLTAFKALHEMMKQYEGKELEAFAAVIQQEVQSLMRTLQRIGEAENEAARVLLETAV